MSEIVWYGAFSYYCGRCTIAVSVFVDELIKAWPTLNERATFLIKRDLDKAFADDDEARKNGDSYKRLGWDCDREQWDRVRKLYEY